MVRLLNHLLDVLFITVSSPCGSFIPYHSVHGACLSYSFTLSYILYSFLYYFKFNEVPFQVFKGSFSFLFGPCHVAYDVCFIPSNYSSNSSLDHALTLVSCPLLIKAILKGNFKSAPFTILPL